MNSTSPRHRRLLVLASAAALAALSLATVSAPAGAAGGPAGLAGAAGGPAGPAGAADGHGVRVDAGVLADLAARGSAEVLVHLRERADLSGAAAVTGRAARATLAYQRLTATAERSQAALRAGLAARGVPHRSFWISNAVHLTGDRSLVEALAARRDVASIEPVRSYPLLLPVAAADGPGTAAVEWGLTNIEAPRVWSELSVRGEGIVVANIDTGVQYNHAALVRQYRGNLGNGSFNHNYNWFDPAKVCGNPSTVPCDNNNHGTHTMGTMVGDDGGTNQIGVAPGARWIAAKGCESSSCSSTSLLASGQWVLAPTDLSGANPRPDLHADIVNNSWGGGRGSTWYQETIRSWVAAGIFPAFANGNSGPNCNTANSPGDNPEAYAVGAYDVNNAIASFSSRGVSGVDGATKPNIAAPGVSVRSSVTGGGYSSFSGTSMATPHVAGAVALVWSASPVLRGDIAQTRSLLDGTAIDVSSTGCGGTSAKNNNFGEGRLSAYQAVLNAPRGPTGTLTGVVTDAGTGAAVAGVTVSVSGPSSRSTTTDANGRYTLLLTPGTYSVTAGGGLYQSQTVTGVVVNANQTTTRNFALTRLPTGTLTGTVTDSSNGAALAGATVVATGPVTVSRTTDSTGRYTMTLPIGSYSVTASLALYRSATASVTISANTTTTRSFALVPTTGTLTGTVTNSVTGAPVFNARVYVFGAGGTFTAYTNTLGRYTINRIPAGSYAMHVTASGYFLGSANPTIFEGQTTVVNVLLKPTG
ncbi:MAG TPA: carboxypeptidase regulatory-like domain-containing protein [Micromonosporaceae bacterium]|nr:carboxypeptidase regulatory-like domain-containing protein [Micromonosporaceae bacterium]